MLAPVPATHEGCEYMFGLDRSIQRSVEMTRESDDDDSSDEVVMTKTCLYVVITFYRVDDRVHYLHSVVPDDESFMEHMEAHRRECSAQGPIMVQYTCQDHRPGLRHPVSSDWQSYEIHVMDEVLPRAFSPFMGRLK